MAYHLAVERKPGYLHARVTGDNTPESVLGYLGELQDACRQHHCFTVLIEEDLQGPSLPTLDVFEIVTTQVSAVDRAPRIAFVDRNPAHDTSRMAFAQTVAENRGLTVRVFGTVAEAEAWLESL
jgi:hypothetical protein